MKKRKILAVMMTIAMLFTMIPASVSAAEKQPAGEEYIEILEMTYMECVKDRSKYCDDVWAEIQQVYQEGRIYGLEEDEVGISECMLSLESLSELTWVKSYADLDAVKSRYLKEIDTDAKNYKKADYNEYNWDCIQDGLYIGKKMIREASTFRAAASGYSEAYVAMVWATTKEELKMYQDEYLDELSRIVNLYIDSKNYSAPLWEEILKVYEEAVAAINNAQQEYELEEIFTKYSEELCNLAKLSYPLDYEAVENIIEEIKKPVTEFFEEMSDQIYTIEGLWEAEDLILELEDELYDVKDRIEAEKLVAETQIGRAHV